MLLMLVLLRPRVTAVPVRNPFETAKLSIACRCTSSLVPVVNALLCGVVRWPRLKPVVKTGSSDGIAVPDEVNALAPTAEEEALLDAAETLSVVPGVVPALETDALEGPAVTLVETPVAKAPASALRNAEAASKGV